MTAETSTLESLGIDLERYPHGDHWGGAMGALWDIAHALEHHGREYVPGDWGFSDSIICGGLERGDEDGQARTIAAYILRHPERERAIIRAGEVLHRYIRRMDRAGMGY